jgi:methionyl-tRNA synthetase
MDILSAGTTIGKPVHLFDKIDDKNIKAQLDKLRKTKEVQAKAKNNGQIKKKKPMIQFDDFTKLDLKIGTIAEAEKMPKADKLLVLKVDMGGGEQRTIVSGIAKHYAPEDILSKQVVVLTNLEPRKLRGVLSEGMVLMAENEEGKLSFVSPDKVISSGSVVR